MFGLIGLAWVISEAGLFKSGDDISYWMAVVGGTMMLLVLLYFKLLSKFDEGMLFWMIFLAGFLGLIWF